MEEGLQINCRHKRTHDLERQTRKYKRSAPCIGEKRREDRRREEEGRRREEEASSLPVRVRGPIPFAGAGCLGTVLPAWA